MWLVISVTSSDVSFNTLNEFWGEGGELQLLDQHLLDNKAVGLKEMASLEKANAGHWWLGTTITSTFFSNLSRSPAPM